MAISRSRSYIAKKPRFALAIPGSRPALQAGEMTMVYECLEQHGSLSLDELVKLCLAKGYSSLFTNPQTDPTISVLFQLRLLETGTLNRRKHAQRQVVREVS
jgi:hypothetical protein